MATYTRWYVAECPLAHECTKQSWDRCNKCHSWLGAAECKANLRKHLQRSGHHSHNSAEMVEDCIELADIQQEECPAHWFEEEKNQEESQQRASAPRTPVGAPPPKRHKSSAIGAAVPMQPAAPPIDSVVQAVVAAMSVPRSSAASSSSSSSLALPQPVDPDMVQVRRSLLKKLHDMVERSAGAAQHAVDIARAAQDGFVAEHRKLSEAARELAKFVDAKEFS